MKLRDRRKKLLDRLGIKYETKMSGKDKKQILWKCRIDSCIDDRWYGSFFVFTDHLATHGYDKSLFYTTGNEFATTTTSWNVADTSGYEQKSVAVKVDPNMTEEQEDDGGNHSVGEEKMYVVTSGKGQEYHIIGIYDSREKAENVRNSLRRNWIPANAVIESYKLNKYSDIKLSDRIFYVKMDKDGNVTRVLNNVDNPDAEDMDYIDEGQVLKDGVYHNEGGYIADYVFADNEEHAIRKVDEKRKMLIVSGEWKD